MLRGERSVSDLVKGLRNNKLTVHHATLRSHAKAFITGLNRYSLPIHLKYLQNMSALIANSPCCHYGSPKLSVHFSKLSVHFHFRLLTVKRAYICHHWRPNERCNLNGDQRCPSQKFEYDLHHIKLIQKRQDKQKNELKQSVSCALQESTR